MQGKGNPTALWWECKLAEPLWRTEWRFLNKLGTKLLYYPEITLLGTNPEKTTIKKTHVHSVQCNTIYNVRTWKQPRCPSTD